MTGNNRRTGTQKEALAASYLAERGVRILHRNFHCRQGEIDIVAADGAYLVFVEVKYRKNTNKGSALGAVDGKKQQRICRVADVYRVAHHIPADAMIRYDVVAIQDGEISWIKNAFWHIAQ